MVNILPALEIKLATVAVGVPFSRVRVAPLVVTSKAWLISFRSMGMSLESTFVVVLFS